MGIFMFKRSAFLSGKPLFKIIMVFMIFSNSLFPQVDENAKKYIRIGSLQSHVSAYGSERAWTGSYYEGLIWPADYTRQDNSVIKRSFLAVRDFVDESGYHWDYWGTNITLSRVANTIFPMKLYQVSKFELPKIYVDGNDLTSIFESDIDSINSSQIPDRIVTNVINTACGLTITRKFLAFSQQYHDNYFIKEIILTNTGNIDYDPEIELNDSLKGVRIGWSTRYSVNREAAYTMVDGTQSWGKHTWVTKRGEDYPDHIGEVFTESNPIQNWLRAGFCYLGINEANTAYNNIGAPYVTKNGRLTSPHHVGTSIIHVPKSVNDLEDDPYQPAVLGWHAGDTYPSVSAVIPSSIPSIISMYEFLKGVPYGGGSNGGTGRFDEENDVLSIDPYTIHNDGGGTNLWIAYGPFDLAPGESITIVESEGINGISRQKCEEVGQLWKEAKDNESTSFSFTMPVGSVKVGTYKDKTADDFKNAWVFTGKDSIMKTFGRAKRNYDSGYQIPQPPLPPGMFNVVSLGDRIELSWSPSPSAGEEDFAGYRVYRAVGKPDTLHTLLATLPSGETLYNDETAVRGFSYYYYLTAFNDGSKNGSGELNPIGPLESGRFYTKTNEPAYLKRKQGNRLSDIRVVPNPFHIQAKDLQFPEQPDKIMFYDVPGKCIIKIFTERGDLIETIKHNDGSGDQAWNSITSSRQVVVSGLYIAYFEVTEDIKDSDTGDLIYKKGDNTMRKFIVIR